MSVQPPPSFHLAIIGGGNMGAAVASGLLARDPKQRILFVEPSDERRSFLRSTFPSAVVDADINARVAQAEIIFLAVKPHQLGDVGVKLRSLLRPHHLVVSILAARTRRELADALGQPERIVRVMPNLPASVGAGASAIAFPQSLGETDRAKIAALMSAVGPVVIEVREEQLDAVTAVSGSGPGYLFYFVQQWIDAACAHLPREAATQLCIQTFIGTAELLKNPENRDMGKMVRAVATPGGTTQAAIDALARHNLSQVMRDAVNESAERSQTIRQKATAPSAAAAASRPIAARL